MGIARQLLQASSYYYINLYQPYNGKYHGVLWHILWNSQWWFEMHVCQLDILLMDFGVFDDEDYNQDLVDEVGIVDSGGLWPWMKIVILTMLMCWKVHLPPWIEN
jgi:hypothetical protein